LSPHPASRVAYVQGRIDGRDPAVAARRADPPRVEADRRRHRRREPGVRLLDGAGIRQRCSWRGAHGVRRRSTVVAGRGGSGARPGGRAAVPQWRRRRPARRSRRPRSCRSAPTTTCARRAGAAWPVRHPAHWRPRRGGRTRRGARGPAAIRTRLPPDCVQIAESGALDVVVCGGVMQCLALRRGCADWRDARSDSGRGRCYEANLTVLRGLFGSVVGVRGLLSTYSQGVPRGLG